MAVEFTIELDETNLSKAEDMGLLKALKMTNNINTTNIVCFDKDGKIKKYNSAEDILKEFYELRLEYYAKRKEHLIYVLKDEFERLDNKAKFIDLVIKKQLIYINRKEEDVIADMKKFGLKPIYPRKKKSALIVADEEENNDDAERDGNGYEYLFSINVRGFTEQKVKELIKQKDAKFVELEEIQGTPPKTFWRRDLDALLEQWDDLLAEDEALAKQAKPIAAAKTAKKRKRVVKPKAKVESSESTPMDVDAS